jgi:pSer/pThr/pTyr-binding forkhead associated (FHA) protein
LVRLDDAFVSMRHARVFWDSKQGWRLEDVESRNGTLLNGASMRLAAIRGGDAIMIGNAVLRVAAGPDEAPFSAVNQSAN